MLDLGTKAPDFSLPDVTTGRRTIFLETFGGKKALVVMFVCHHCPFAKHVSEELARLGRDYAGSSVGILAISSSDPAVSSDDSPEGLKRMAAEWGLSFPVCYDESQETAKSYAAACTPDLYLFDEERRLVYRAASSTTAGRATTLKPCWPAARSIRIRDQDGVQHQVVTGKRAGLFRGESDALGGTGPVGPASRPVAVRRWTL